MKKIVSFILGIMFVLNLMFIPVLAQRNSDEVIVKVTSTIGKPGEVKSIRVMFENVLQPINNCDFKLDFDDKNLDVEDVVVGEIVPNETYFSYHIRGNKIYFLFNDESLGENPIIEDGVFAEISFKINDNTSYDDYNIDFKSRVTFGNQDLKKINSSFTGGVISVQEDEFNKNIRGIGESTFDVSIFSNDDAIKLVNNEFNQVNSNPSKTIFGCDNVQTKMFRVGFEDLSPYYSIGNDLDYNDFVFDMYVNEYYYQGKLRMIYASFDPKARGAAYEHALKINLKNAYASSGNDFAFSWTKLTENGNVQIINVMNNYNNYTPIEMFNSTKDVFPKVQGSIFTNTDTNILHVNPFYSVGLIIVIGNNDNTNEGEPTIRKYEPILKPNNLNDISPIEETGGKPNAIVKEYDWKWPREKVNIDNAYFNGFDTIKDITKIYN